MIKGILKEIIIILLIALAIILLLGILLYDYVPMKKVVPTTESYVATEEVKQALEEKAETENDKVVLTYEVTSTDIKNYKKGNDYKAGRKNPFSSVNTVGGTTTNGQTSNGSANGTNNNNNNSSNNNNNDSNSNNSGTNTGNNTNSTNYYPDKGTK